ncbi:MAG: hypothetical protein ACXU8O_00470 [Asticcacaulis sp.]
MKLKLYDRVWVELAGHGPQMAVLESEDPKVFRALSWLYRDDGRPLSPAPQILLVYSRGCFRVER